MGLEQLELESGMNKTEVAISILQAWEPPEGYYFADSGGACSSVVRDILMKAKVKFDAHYCVSPIDPPQIRQFLKEHHPDTQWDYHARGFWKMVPVMQLPLRQQRWCCKYIKEAGGDGRIKVVGNRRDEGNSRRNQCYWHKHTKRDVIFIRPILNFTHFDLWQYIRENDVPYCYLYDEGVDSKFRGYGKGIFQRLGCVLCPFSRNIERDTKYFPELIKLWRMASQRTIEYQHSKGRCLDVKTGDELFNRWIQRD